MGVVIGSFKRAWRDYLHSGDWSPFMAGYRAALRDIERTGLRPTKARTIRYCAEQAFSDTYGGTPPRRPVCDDT